MDRCSFIILIFSIEIYSKEEQKPIEPLCSTPGKTERRCCTGYRTVAGKCHICMGAFGLECSSSCPDGYYGLQCLEKCHCAKCNITTGKCIDETELRPNMHSHSQVGTNTKTEFPWKILVGTLCGIIVVLIVLLVAAVLHKRKLPYSRPYQDERVTSDTVSLEYASVENNTYLECNPASHAETQISDDSMNQNQLEENKTDETGSGHYLSVNPKPSFNADVWKSIKETVEKNRERNSMLRLLSRRNIPPSKSPRCSYVTVVEEQSPSSI